MDSERTHRPDASPSGSPVGPAPAGGGDAADADAPRIGAAPAKARARTAWLIGTDPRLTLRLNRILIAVAVYAVSLLAQWHAVRLGIADAAEARWLAGFIGVGVCAFFVAVRSGWTLRFEDPALTLPQMVFGIGAIAVAYQVNPQVRGVLPMLAGVVILFGVFTLSPRSCRRLGWLSVGIFGAAMIAGTLRNPAVYVPRIELHHFAFAAVSLLTMSILAAQLSAMRLSWKQQRQELREALARLVASEKSMAEAKAAAEAASEAKSRFLANMSHEIRTPMNGVVGMADLLLATSLTTRQQHFARTLRSSADAMLRLLNDILDFSKIEMGRLDIERLQFDARHLVEEVALHWAEPAQAKGLELFCDIDAGAPGWVWGDPHRIRQGLGNFVSNAVKFTDSGEVAIGLSLTQHQDDGLRFLQFRVRDTGPGIAEETLPRLFSAFSQGDSSTTRRFGGTGLGLAITRQLAELMGGAAGAESRTGSGTLMWLTIPYEPASVPSSTRAGAEIRAGLRVLVVESHGGAAAALREALLRIGAVPQHAATAAKAVRLVLAAGADGRFDAVIYREDRRSGQDGSLEHALETSPRTLAPRLIRLVPASAMAKMEDRSLRGAHACLPYPVTEAALRTALADALTGSAMPPAQPVPARAPDPALSARILLAEDNDVNAEIALELLRDLGCSVERVCNGRDAVDRFRRNRYDLVLMDCQMPEMDGFEATARIRADEFDPSSPNATPPRGRVPIIALTANALRGDRDRCIAAGMDDHLAKPFRSEQLSRVLRQWLGPTFGR